MKAAGDNRHGLEEIFNDPSFASVLSLSNMISPEQLAQYGHPSRAQWEAIFCGTTGKHRLPKNVSLHKEETQAVASRAAYDIRQSPRLPNVLGRSK